jgi:putative aldouronate transport system substrate-binding protein
MGRISAPEEGFSCYYFDDDYGPWLVQMKEWLEKGYWSRSVLSSTTNSERAMQAGTSASYIGHYDSMRNGIETAMRQPQTQSEGWEFWVFRNDQMLPDGKAAWINSLQDCISIPRQAQSPERSMLLIELLNVDQECNDLIQRGVEGVNWTVDEQGRFFIDGEAGQAAFDINAWCFRNVTTYRDKIYSWPRYTEYDTVHRLNTIASPIEGFRFKAAGDWNDFMSEVDTIVSEYHLQMLTGLSDDPLASLDAAKQRLKDAGVDAFLAAVNAEFDAWWAEQSAN